MKQLPTLYARGNNGKTLEWSVEVKADKYRFITGAQGFKQVTSEWSVASAKNVGRANETTVEEQALSEAKSHWEKKIKRNGYWESIKDIDKTTFVEPMLAHHLKDRLDKISFPAMLDRKYNGGRVVITRHGAFTRKGEPWVTIPHITKVLEPLFEQFPDLVIDGEGYNHDYRYKLNELMKILRKSKKVTSEDLTNSEKMVRYYVYDGYGFDLNANKNMGGEITQETPCFQRRDFLKELLKNIPYIVVVPYETVQNTEEVYKIYQEYVDDGYEGAIFRTWNAPYVNKRSYDLLKVKPEDDAEAIIVDIKEGTGNWAGTGKVISLKWKEREFDASFKGTREQAIQFLADKKKWVGKTVTFLYNGLTGLGNPNYARIDIDNCIKGDR